MFVIFTFIIIILCLVIYIIKLMVDIHEYKSSNLELINNYDRLLSQKKSSEVKLGQISEHLVPFLENFPYDPKDAKFLGEPIDYLVYDLNNDKIVFLEIKTGGAQLSSKQRKIRDLIKEGKVFWEVIRLK